MDFNSAGFSNIGIALFITLSNFGIWTRFIVLIKNGVKTLIVYDARYVILRKIVAQMTALSCLVSIVTSRIKDSELISLFCFMVS